MRNRFLGWIGTALLLGAGASVAAQDDVPEALQFQGYEISRVGDFGEVAIDSRGDTEELVLTRAAVLLGGAELSEGVIEFDVAFDATRGFGGLMWHVGDDPGDYEYFYLRKHKSGLPDAGQYTPARGGLTSWQIYSDTNAMAPLAFTYDGWNRIRFVIADDKADIYFNGSPMPVLHIPDLATDRGNGGVGFRTSGPNGVLRIANLTIRDLAPGEGIVGTPSDVPAPPDGVIARWRVSKGFDESLVADALSLPSEVEDLPSIAELSSEPTGIVDLSRAITPEDGADTALVSIRIIAAEATRVRLRFGYSDRLRLFLNGELIFDGAAGFRQRDFCFLGTVGFDDAVVLELEEGENVLSAAVSETFGGWGFAASIADGEGLQISP